MAWRYLWLGLVVVGLGELAGQLYFSRRAPQAQAWEQLAPAVDALRQPGDLLVVAPHWAEPLARQALGDERMPLDHLARPEAAIFSRALEISTLGQQAKATRGWDVVEERQVGEFRLRVLDNPSFARRSFNLLDAFSPVIEAFFETEDSVRSCRYRTNAPARAGGLPGTLGVPSERFECPGSREHWVGLTVIDDQDYRPRRCLYAHPPRAGKLVLRFEDVQLSQRLYGYAGLSYLLTREGRGVPVVLTARVNGQPVGRYVHRDEDGWAPFSFELGEHAGSRAELRFELSSASSSLRRFCFYADSR